SPSQVTKKKRASPKTEFDKIEAKVDIIHRYENYMKNKKNPWVISVTDENINVVEKLYKKLTIQRLEVMAFNNLFLSIIFDLDIIDKFITKCFTHDELLKLSEVEDFNFLPSNKIKAYRKLNFQATIQLEAEKSEFIYGEVSEPPYKTISTKIETDRRKLIRYMKRNKREQEEKFIKILE
ncbi:1115_t:CDS:2, partial [Dentiscutata heterogama]